MTEEEKAIARSEKIVEYGKLYLQRKAEGVSVQDLPQIEKTKIFKYLLNYRMSILTETIDESTPDEEFIMFHEKKLGELRGK